MIEDLYKHKFGDRRDGWRVQGMTGPLTIMPYLQRTRSDGQCYFSDLIDLAPLDRLIEEHKEDLPGLSIMHIFIAALVRTFSQRPYLNRFLVNSLLYAHKNILVSFMVKKTLDDQGEETAVRSVFSPWDTLYTVVEKNNKAIEKYRANTDTSTDKVVGLLEYLPSPILRFLMFFVRFADQHGLLPRSLYEASPYHSSAVVTNMGSLGIAPIYHHLYDFGTCSFFLAMGKKVRRVTVSRDGRTTVRRYVGVKFVVDERVCDGHYMAASFRHLYRLLSRPEELLTKPSSIVLDDRIRRPLRYDPNKIVST